jgi:hypothetical protein
MTVVRATTATRVNSAGLIESVANNVPRLDYSNGTCPSILVEPQRTNDLIQSQALASGYTFNQCSITSNQTSPDGTSNAKRITNGGTANDAYFEQSIGITDNTYTWSIFVKQGTATTATIRPVHVGIGGDVSLLTFTFATQTITSSALITTSGFIALPNGWYRIFCSIPITLAVSSLRGRFGNPNTPNVYNDWAFPQLEVGSYPTSYIPTTSAAVTRNADAISKTGISALIGQTEGTIFGDIIINSESSPTMILFLSSAGTYSDAVYMQQPASDTVNFRVFSGGTVQCLITYSGLTNGQRVKIAGAYKANDFVLYVNGVQAGTDTSGSVPSGLSRIEVGSYDEVGAPYFQNRPINLAAVFPTRLTNSELASLTTI